MRYIASISVLLFLMLIAPLSGRSFRVTQIPNGSKNGCLNCHINPQGGGERNSFGKLVEARFMSAPGSSGNVVWGSELAMLDADGDGESNGAELQDPAGNWSIGQPFPGISSLVTLPGLASSNTLTTATVKFSAMTPVLGKLLELRVIDKLNSTEIFRTQLPAVTTADFDLVLNQILPSHNYFIDFYADLNMNGRYDTPPADPSWRIDFTNARGNDVLAFSFNTDFTDVQWPSSTTDVYTLTNFPSDILLEQNYPNPFNPATMIRYELNIQQKITLTVFDIMGNEIVTLINTIQPAGQYNVLFDAGKYHSASGVYFYRITSSEKIITRKMNLIK